MPNNPTSSQESVNVFIENLRQTLSIADAHLPPEDVLLLDILLSFEHILDRSRVLFGTYVPLENRVCSMDELHAQLDALRSQISTRLKSLETNEAKALLQSRLTEAGSSWWHVTRQDAEK